MRSVLILLSLFLVVSGELKAQVVLDTNNSIPIINATYHYTHHGRYSVSPGKSEKNRTWDFSDAKGQKRSSLFIDAASGSKFSDFPSATHVEILGNSEIYYRAASDGFWWVGSYNRSMKENYTDNRLWNPIPLKYGQTIRDSLIATITQSIVSYPRVGETVITGHAEGSLKLPQKTYSNTLCIVSVTKYTESIVGISYGRVDSSIRWYDKNTSMFLASYTAFSTNGVNNLRRLAVLDSITLPKPKEPVDTNVSVVSFSNQDHKIVMYPNPAKDEVKFSSLQGVNLISVVDVTGKVVLRKNTKNLSEADISVQHLDKGMYFVRFENETSSITKRLFVDN